MYTYYIAICSCKLRPVDNIVFLLFYHSVSPIQIADVRSLAEDLDMEATFGPYWDMYAVTLLLGINIMIGMFILARRNYL